MTGWDLEMAHVHDDSPLRTALDNEYTSLLSSLHGPAHSGSRSGCSERSRNKIWEWRQVGLPAKTSQLFG